MKALKVLRRNCGTEEQFMTEISMLGLDDLVTL